MVSKAIVIVLGVCFGLGVYFFLSNKNNEKSFFDFVKRMGESLVADIKNFTASGHLSPLFKSWTQKPFVPGQLNTDISDFTPKTAFLTCLGCRTYIGSVIRDIRAGASQQHMINAMSALCMLLSPFEKMVCLNMITANMEAFFFVIQNRPLIGSKQFCDLALQGECDPVDPMFNFTINVSPHEPITAPKSVKAPRTADELHIIHIADSHCDEHYMTGAVNNCRNPVCCRRSDGIAPDPANRAGAWGDYKCNTPWDAFENTLQQIQRTHKKVDLIYHTGDMVDNGQWQTSRDYNKMVIGKAYDLVKKYFPKVPVYPIIGNHEHHPTNLYAPSTIVKESLSSRWLYDFLANKWQSLGWIDEAAAKTIRIAGYYTMLVRPGFRVIGLNNNDNYVFNFWVMYSRTEIASALQWFHDTLLEAERNKEMVHILAHIPIGGDHCLGFWSRQYRRVIDRFHKIIGAQFTGHTHKDEFEVNYDVATASHAVNIAWNGGSVTTLVNINPNYKMYYVDRTYYQVNEAESYIYSISEARTNSTVPPRWYKQYSFGEAFGVNDFSPAGISQTIFNISKDRNLARKLFKYQYKDGDPIVRKGCNDLCLRKLLCDLVTNESGDRRTCLKVLAVYGTVA